MPVSALFDRVRTLSPERPLRTLWRRAGYKLRPPKPLAYAPSVNWRTQAALATGEFREAQLAEVLAEMRPGPLPTIVLGGFVPDATESVYLLRGMLLRHGSVYYFNYPRDGFSTRLLFAQLDDLLEELTSLHGAPPVITGISFGCGLLMEWLRQARRADRTPAIRGIVMISPVTCVADVLESGIEKPTTLLGRALFPLLLQLDEQPEAKAVDRCRTLMLRMFESGAQNRQVVRTLLTKGELLLLRHRVMTTLKSITAAGAVERVRALAAMEPPNGFFTQAVSPLSEAPTMILFAEKETSVLIGNAPSLLLREHGRLLFPSAQIRLVAARRGSPVQHASLIFHAFNFLPPLAVFYRRLRTHVAMEQGRFRLLRWRLPSRPLRVA